MIEVGKLTEYREAARAECGAMTREQLLDHIGFLYRKGDVQTNQVQRWRIAYYSAGSREGASLEK